MFDVVLTSNYSPWSRYSGGGQKSTHMLACAYASLGYRVAVVYTKAPFESVDVPKGLPYTVRFALFFSILPTMGSVLRWLNGIPVYFKVRQLSNENTVVIGNGDESSLLGHVRKKDFLYCTRFPNPPEWLKGVNWNSPVGRMMVFFREPRFAAIAMAMGHARSVACTSRDSLLQTARAFPLSAQKLRVVPNGVDPMFLESPCKDSAGHGILFFGRLTASKGILDLIEAYLAMPKDLQVTHSLMIVGHGPLTQKIESMIGTVDHIRLVSWLDSSSLCELIRQHRMVVLPSHEESFGNTMLETIAMGQDLLTCNAGSIPEVVEDQACLVPPDSPGLLRNAMLECLAKPFDPDLAIMKREWVRSRYSWKVTASRLLEGV